MAGSASSLLASLLWTPLLQGGGRGGVLRRPFSEGAKEASSGGASGNYVGVVRQ